MTKASAVSPSYCVGLSASNVGSGILLSPRYFLKSAERSLTFFSSSSNVGCGVEVMVGCESRSGV